MTVQEGVLLCGRYRLQRSIGRGGMADVYLAFDKKRQAPVAVKILREDLAEDPVLTRRFCREAEALARLDHPNIVRFYAFEQDGPIAFIVMDYIDGTTLRRLLLERRKPLDVKEITPVLRDICSALHYAHLNGTVHRDLKPGNVMLKQDGKALLTDFGISCAMEGATLTGMVMGTPAYMSPEQIAGRQMDARSDIYSLGVLLFEMATGQRPFTGEEPGLTETGTTPRIQEAHLRLPPPDPRTFNPRLPSAAAAVILRALAKQPADRWPDVVSLRQAWETAVGVPRAFDDTDIIAAGKLQAGEALPVRPPAARRGLPHWMPALVGVAVLAVAAVLAIAARPPAAEKAAAQATAQPARATSTVIVVSQAPASTQAIPGTPRSTAVRPGIVVATAAPATTIPTTLTHAPTSTIVAEDLGISSTRPLTATLATLDEPTVAPTRTTEPTRTRTPLDKATPRPTSAPNMSTPRPTQARAATATSASQVAGGVVLVSPAASSLINADGAVTFAWGNTGGFALKPGETYELIFWKPGENPMPNGMSPIAATTDTKALVNLVAADTAGGVFGQHFERGSWYWGIALRNVRDVRLLLLSEARLLTYEPPSTRGQDNSKCDPVTDPSCKG